MMKVKEAHGCRGRNPLHSPYARHSNFEAVSNGRQLLRGRHGGPTSKWIDKCAPLLRRMSQHPYGSRLNATSLPNFLSLNSALKLSESFRRMHLLNLGKGKRGGQKKKRKKSVAVS